MEFSIQLIDRHERDYDIRKTQSSKQYRITVPSKISDTLGLDPSEKLSFVPRCRRGSLELLYISEPEKDGFQNVSYTRADYSGVIRIPSAFGSAIRTQGATVTWSAVEVNGREALYGKTNIKLDSFEPDHETEHAEKIEHKKQQGVNGEWDQSHYRYYVNSETLDKLSWDIDKNLNLTLQEFGGLFALVVRQAGLDYGLDKKLSQTKRGVSSGLLYVPNSIATPLMAEKPAKTYVTDQGLLFVAPESK